MGQPGDPYGAQREAQQREAAKLFSGSVYAHRAWQRAQADLMYLSLWRTDGPVEAGRKVCHEFGHEVVGQQCIRCGVHGSVPA